MSWYSVCSFLSLFFSLEPTVRKDTWMRTTSITVRVVSLKVPFWKLLDQRYVKSSFSTIARHSGNSILKENLHLKIFRTCIKIGAYSFIKTWVSINENRIGYFKYYYLHKKLSQHFKENDTKIDEIWTIFTILFFSQTNLVFKFIQMFIFDSFRHNVFTPLSPDY